MSSGTKTRSAAALALMFAAFMSIPPAVAEDSSPPSEPIGVVALPGLDGSVQLSWQPPLSDGGAPVTEYLVFRSEFPGAFALVGSSNTTNYTDSLEAATAPLYLYQVAAVNVAGRGGDSGPTPGGGSCIDLTIDVPPGLGIDWVCLGLCPLPQPLPYCITDIVHTRG